MSKRVIWLLLTAVLPTALLLLIPTLPGMATNIPPPVQAASSTIVIDAVLYDGLESSEPDEAVRIRNISDSSIDIGEWQLTDGSSTAIIPTSTNLFPDQAIWLTKDGQAFARQYGFLPDFEVIDNNPSVPNLSGTWPGFANTGDEVILKDVPGNFVDVLVYEGGDASLTGWTGTAVTPYSSSNLFGQEGQILYRRRDQVTGLPVPDTDTAADWAQSRDDVINGRKVLYPGWDLDEFFFTTQVTETAVLTIAIAPDNAYVSVVHNWTSLVHFLDIDL